MPQLKLGKSIKYIHIQQIAIKFSSSLYIKHGLKSCVRLIITATRFTKRLWQKNSATTPNFLHVFGRAPSDLQLCFVRLKTVAPSARYSTCKYPATLGCVMDVYRHAKFSHDPSRGFFSPYARNCASKCLLGFSFLGSSNDLQPRCLKRFSRVIRQTTRFRPRMCLFGVRRQKFNIYTP